MIPRPKAARSELDTTDLCKMDFSVITVSFSSNGIQPALRQGDLLPSG